MKRAWIKWLALLLVLLQVVTFTACQSGGQPPAESTADSTLLTPTGTSESIGSGTLSGEGEPEPGGTTAPTQPAKREIKNLILVLGDGLGIEHIAAGEMLRAKEFAFLDWHYASVNTDSVKSSGRGPVLTDSAAAGTALATGKLTVNGYVGKDYTQRDASTILDLAKKAYGKSTGVVTTDTLFGATPAAFSAHSLSRDNTEEIVTSQLASEVDLLCGSINTNCTSRQGDIAAAGYAYCQEYAKLGETMNAKKAYWQLDLYGTEATVELKDAALCALDFLDQNENGFVLMIEQAHIDKYSHENNFAGMVASVDSLNNTVEAILSWLGDRDDTAILITADHETGGLSVSLADRYSEAYPVKVGKVDTHTIYYKWTTTNHTNAKVGLFVFGAAADFSKFEYFNSEHLIKNTDVYELMADILKYPTDY